MGELEVTRFPEMGVVCASSRRDGFEEEEEEPVDERNSPAGGGYSWDWFMLFIGHFWILGRELRARTRWDDGKLECVLPVVASCQ